ncbi:4Fe-4S ferredoxin iron-sulfur binding domain protein [Desulfurobacterium thermolithotrophum DSM 11699]|uniref:4Fe-4S ferredoxin iron-sulfur binding domain protein n=1 Tax=Desulfurobacterium thermolithotrophum (strain DSM 11699 / BSA) TaxID=868864 RepID=F0S1R6_DESTD|nr:4Fe-4S binding protein [Desulfurobacterium thermolithotrophum]ADY72921.1 4Fe-4S ferredoxin iron-sulfur binding domain protein [Desulfurobacterium thermolithotrophum DSM 11699]
MKIQKLRFIVQTAFFLLIAYGIYKYYLFVFYGSNRPDFLDAFLPIVGVYDIIMKIRTGITDPFHPAAMPIMLAVILITFILGKGFCSWICPVGTLLDYITWLRNKLLFIKKIDNVGSKLKNWKYFFALDIPLRSLKYLILGWFLYNILLIPAQMMSMMAQNISAAADIELFKFWIDLFHGKENLFAAILVLILIFSFIIPRFWCKYLCPLGAFYGIFNLFSLTHLRRSPKTCTQCKQCSNCLIGLTPYKTVEFNNSECVMCLQCKSKCTHDAMKLQILGRNVPLWIYPFALIGVFIGIIGLFMAAGIWHSHLTMRDEAYLLLNHGFDVEWARNILMK